MNRKQSTPARARMCVFGGQREGEVHVGLCSVRMWTCMQLDVNGLLCAGCFLVSNVCIRLCLECMHTVVSVMYAYGCVSAWTGMREKMVFVGTYSVTTALVSAVALAYTIAY